jgi:N-acetylglutamate synthase-like GNAT family acetyltransferase
MGISAEYRGKRLVRKVRTDYDATIDKYVTVYNDGEVYGFTETEYSSPASVRSFVTNPNNFDSKIGWDI